MRLRIFLATAMLVVTLVQLGWAAPAPFKRGKSLTPLEKKMVGTWRGMGGCDGRFVFREDWTYELTGYGPDNSETTGVWKVEGDSLPATLVLTCKTSKLTEEVGKSMKVKLTVLDHRNFAIEYSEQNGSPSGKYTQAKK